MNCSVNSPWFSFGKIQECFTRPLWLGTYVVSNLSLLWTVLLGLPFGKFVFLSDDPLGIFLLRFCQIVLYQKRNRYTVQLEICTRALFSTSLTTVGLRIVFYFRWYVSFIAREVRYCSLWWEVLGRNDLEGTDLEDTREGPGRHKRPREVKQLSAQECFVSCPAAVSAVVVIALCAVKLTLSLEHYLSGPLVLTLSINNFCL